MAKKKNELQEIKQHDEKVFLDGDAIFSEGDLRELINTVYAWYQYKGSQWDKLVKLIEFLALETNKYNNPELANEYKKVSDYLDNFSEFLKSNFQKGEKCDDGDQVYYFKNQETRSENEAFLIEFQMVSMDIETAYKKYRKTVMSILKI